MTILMKGNYHRNDYCDSEALRDIYMLNNTFKWVQGEKAVNV